MDFANKLKDLAGGQGHSGQSTTGAQSTTGGQGGAAGSAGKEDYGDKGSPASSPCQMSTNTLLPGLDFLEKKTGHTFSREQNEKITDTAREQFEKMTG